VDVAQEMDPTPLMQALVDVVRRVKITAQHPFKRLSQQVLDHFLASRVVVFVIAQAGRIGAPDVAIAPILSPSCLIGLHGGTGSHSRFDRLHFGLHLDRAPREQFTDLSGTDRQSMHALEEQLDLSHWHAQYRSQRGDQAGYPHAHSSLTHNLPLQI
jgi:hypothetical protein